VISRSFSSLPGLCQNVFLFNTARPGPLSETSDPHLTDRSSKSSYSPVSVVSSLHLVMPSLSRKVFFCFFFLIPRPFAVPVDSPLHFRPTVAANPPPISPGPLLEGLTPPYPLLNPPRSLLATCLFEYFAPAAEGPVFCDPLT